MPSQIGGMSEATENAIDRHRPPGHIAGMDQDHTNYDEPKRGMLWVVAATIILAAIVTTAGAGAIFFVGHLCLGGLVC
jgi:hypothetical protein